MFATTDTIPAGDATLRTHRAGDPDRPAVVIASACGMPAALCEPWLRRLADDFFVVTWETRGMFGDPADGAEFDRMRHDVAAQAADLAAVADHYGIADAHVMGLCGGAVVALSAAAARPDLVGSLSLWHGDFSGSKGPVTGHQDNLRALLGMAVAGRADAAMINGVLAASARAGVPPHVADLVTHPYSTDELFYRYSVLTLPTMTEDITPVLPAVTAPVLVVTSEDDSTAHPAGSHRVAAGLPRAVLRVEPHGDHVSAFGAGPHLEAILADFLSAGTGTRGTTHD